MFQRVIAIMMGPWKESQVANVYVIIGMLGINAIFVHQLTKELIVTFVKINIAKKEINVCDVNAVKILKLLMVYV